MIALLRRLWSVIIGLVMISLSLIFQLLFIMLIAGIAVPEVLPQLDPRITFVVLFVLFNGVSLCEYFRRRRVVTFRNPDRTLGNPDSWHTSMAIFLLPRGIDRIINGRELTGEN
jgi:hypothetical protein